MKHDEVPQEGRERTEYAIQVMREWLNVARIMCRPRTDEGLWARTTDPAWDWARNDYAVTVEN